MCIQRGRGNENRECLDETERRVTSDPGPHIRLTVPPKSHTGLPQLLVSSKLQRNMQSTAHRLPKTAFTDGITGRPLASRFLLLMYFKKYSIIKLAAMTKEDLLVKYVSFFLTRATPLAFLILSRS